MPYMYPYRPYGVAMEEKRENPFGSIIHARDEFLRLRIRLNTDLILPPACFGITPACFGALRRRLVRGGIYVYTYFIYSGEHPDIAPSCFNDRVPFKPT